MNGAGGNITPETPAGIKQITNALSLYNSGKKWDEGGNQIAETRNYIDRIFQFYSRLRCATDNLNLALPLGSHTSQATTNNTPHTISAGGHGLFISLHGGSQHSGDGIDLIVAPTYKKQPIYAVTDARIEKLSEYVSKNYGYGGWNIYLYNSNNGIEALYAHVLPKFNLTVGDMVKKGEQIGWIYPHDIKTRKKIWQENRRFPNQIPNLGFHTKSHVHFQLWVNGEGISQAWMEQKFGIKK